MKNIVIIIVLFCVSSCKIFFKEQKKIYKSKNVEIYYYKDYNNFKMISKVWGVAGTDIYYHYHYQINVPKKIKNWMLGNKNLYVEYDSKQMIVVEGGYKNRGGDIGEWTLKDIPKNHDAEKHIIESYRLLNNKEYDEKYLEKISKNRISQVYTNGKSSIYLYNVKKENYEEFLKFAKTFSYIEIE
jgi:hypothetical protein